MNPIDTARRASADHAARHPDAGFYALPGQLRDLGDPWEHLRADAQRQLDRAQVSALLDTAGVPAHADLAERVTMLVEHDREMAADGLRLAEVIEDRNNCRQRLARVREEIGEHAEDCEQQRAHLANPGRVGACSWCRPLSALTQDAIAEDPS